MSKPIDLQKPPASQRAEESVIGSLLRSEDARTEILSSALESVHFYFRPYRLLYEEIVERYYADDAIDPLSVAEAIGPRLGEQWKVPEREAVDKVAALAKPDPSDMVSVAEHARIVKRHHDYRELLHISSSALNEAIEQDRDPEEIAGALSASATKVVTGAMINNELLSYGDLGRRWTRQMQAEIAARAQGIELGAFFSIPALDQFVKGLRPSELMILGGDPGVGKSGLAWAMGRNFALRQMKKPPDRRVGTLFLSLEMGEQLSSTRFAQIESRTTGETLRLGSLTRSDLTDIAQKWAAHRDLPIIANHSGSLRESQIRALCVEAIRRHQVGLVIVDHFRFIKTDERFENKNDADEQIVQFLKGTLAKDLNLAVVCLAHTTKGGTDNRRPVQDDLRGSKMISAFADVVSFMYWPWKHATQEKRERGLVAREEYELIHDKVRQAAPGTGELWADMSTMSFR